MPQWLTDRIRDLEGFSLQKLLPAITIFVIGILAIRLILKILTTALQKAKLEKAAAKLIRSLLRIVLYILLFLSTASALGIDVTGIVALASVLTLAVSLSVQNALTNVIGGFTLLYTKPFVSGDFVEIAGQSGTVADVGLTYTKLSTADNKIISIPNSSVVAAEIVNYSVCGTRRLDIHVYVDREARAETVVEALLKAAKLPHIPGMPTPFAGIKEYGESAIVYVLQVWTPADQYWPAKFTINQNIQSVFRESGIPMANLRLRVHFDQ